MGTTPLYANPFQRLVAYMIDLVIVHIVVFVVSFLVSMLIFILREIIPISGNSFRTTFPYRAVVSIVFTKVIFFIYHIFFWRRYGATPGKMALRIKIVKEDGSYLSIGGAVLRLICYFTSAFPFGLGYLWMIWDAKRQCWHDKIVHSYVIRVL